MKAVRLEGVTPPPRNTKASWDGGCLFHLLDWFVTGLQYRFQYCFVFSHSILEEEPISPLGTGGQEACTLQTPGSACRKASHKADSGSGPHSMVTPTHWNDLVYRLWIFMNYEVVCDLTWGWYWWKFWHCFPSPPSLPWAACVLSRSPGSQPLAAQEKQMPPGQGEGWRLIMLEGCFPAHLLLHEVRKTQM